MLVWCRGCCLCYVYKECVLFVSSRQIRSDRKEKNAVMSFTVTDEPTFVDLTVSEVKEEVRPIVCKQICSTVFAYHINFLLGV